MPGSPGAADDTGGQCGKGALGAAPCATAILGRTLCPLPTQPPGSSAAATPAMTTTAVKLTKKAFLFLLAATIARLGEGLAIKSDSDGQMTIYRSNDSTAPMLTTAVIGMTTIVTAITIFALGFCYGKSTNKCPVTTPVPSTSRATHHVQTQSPTTYTWHNTQPRFTVLPAYGHGAWPGCATWPG